MTVTDGSGNPISPNSWGTPHSATGNPCLFTGRHLDEETGLDYYRERYYSANYGCFLKRDPINASLNLIAIHSNASPDHPTKNTLYGYPGENPINLVDPFGLAGAPCVCGPDITADLKRVIKDVQRGFMRLSSDDKMNHCTALDDPTRMRWNALVPEPFVTWDIIQLHNHGWIWKMGFPFGCAIPYALCGNTVEVDKKCYYAGSVNYVIFGTMFRLCADSGVFGRSLWDEHSYSEDRYSSGKMLNLIDNYKGTGLFGMSTPSGNYLDSSAWAIAGYNLWEIGRANSPPGDRRGCATKCPKNCPKNVPFTVNWNQKVY